MIRLIPTDSRLSSAQPTRRAVVFLDRDGVLVEDVHYLRRVAQVRLLPGVAQALRMLAAHFWLIVATNQSGLARGYLTEAELAAIHQALLAQLQAEGATLDAIYACPHLPDGTVPAYRMACTCRKPAPGMLLRACQDWAISAEDSYMVGDTPRDIEAGNAAGLQAILIGANTCPLPTSRPSLWAEDLLRAAYLICHREGLA